MLSCIENDVKNPNAVLVTALRRSAQPCGRGETTRWVRQKSNYMLLVENPLVSGVQLLGAQLGAAMACIMGIKSISFCVSSVCVCVVCLSKVYGFAAARSERKTRLVIRIDG
jgi:hypothetical protein